MKRLVLIALLALCGSAAAEEVDSFGWSIDLVELCGKPFTQFITDDAEYGCVMRGGVWYLERTP